MENTLLAFDRTLEPIEHNNSQIHESQSKITEIWGHDERITPIRSTDESDLDFTITQDK